MNDYAKELVDVLKENNLKLALAESCTGGLISKMITDVEGASRVFECGVVSYSNRVKASVLGVKKSTLEKYGAVSPETVKEMSEGAIKISGADISAVVSGIAGPGSDESGKPPGLIYIAVNFKGKITIKELFNEFNKNIRENNRNTAATETLKLIIETIINETGVN